MFLPTKSIISQSLTPRRRCHTSFLPSLSLTSSSSLLSFNRSSVQTGRNHLKMSLTSLKISIESYFINRTATTKNVLILSSSSFFILRLLSADHTISSIPEKIFVGLFQRGPHLQPEVFPPPVFVLYALPELLIRGWTNERNWSDVFIILTFWLMRPLSLISSRW